MTLEAGRISTWRLPRFSALKMLRRQSFSTEMRTILPGSEQGPCQRTGRAPSLSGEGAIVHGPPASTGSPPCCPIGMQGRRRVCHATQRAANSTWEGIAGHEGAGAHLSEGLRATLLCKGSSRGGGQTARGPPLCREYFAAVRRGDKCGRSPKWASSPVLHWNDVAFRHAHLDDRVARHCDSTG